MKTIVAGIGNVFLGDDGFGCEVAAELLRRPTPQDVRVEDYGIRSTHLAIDLLAGYDLLILLDALAGNEPPGTVRLLELGPVATATTPDAHVMTPESMLQLVASSGGEIGRVLVVGCQPESVAPGMGLSPAVQAAVDPAARMVQSLLEENHA